MLPTGTKTMSSNGDWGTLAEFDTELADVWDGFSSLPMPGTHNALDAFVERKRVSVQSLARLGARLSAPSVLAFAFPGGIKYRDITTGKRWSYHGSEWRAMKIVRADPAGPTDLVMIAEGETDAARLSECYGVDVAVLPAGAKYFPSAYAQQLDHYTRVLACLDNDEAGEAGWHKIKEHIPHAERFAPPECYVDWCDTPDAELPSVPEAPTVERLDVLVSAGQMLDLEVPEVASWFEHDLLPIGGLLMLHGWAKSFKTFLALDMLAALSQGQDWCCFEPIEEPCKVAVIQFELKWPYYRERVEYLRKHAREPQLFDENFMTWTPLTRPQLRAGDSKTEDHVIKTLVDGGVQVVLLDPIRRATGDIDMNDEGEVRKMLAFFERLNDHGITVVATHHDNKTAARTGGGDPLGMTGSGAWSGDPDTIVSVSLPVGDQLHSSKRRNVNFTLRNSPSISPRSFEMQDDGHILYSPNAVGGREPEDSPDDPSI